MRLLVTFIFLIAISCNSKESKSTSRNTTEKSSSQNAGIKDQEKTEETEHNSDEDQAIKSQDDEGEREEKETPNEQEKDTSTKPEVQPATDLMVETKLLPSAVLDGAHYGSAIAVSEDIIVVGAHIEGSDDTKLGSVYVFSRSDSGWQEEAKLTASDASLKDEFGYAVAIDGDTIAVSAFRGYVYVFTRSTTSSGPVWNEQAKLIAADSDNVKHLGVSLALSGNTIVATTVVDDSTPVGVASAYVFVRSGSTWTQQAKLVPEEDTPLTRFGRSVDIHADTIAIGAPGDEESVYVFNRSGNEWTEQVRLMGSDLGIAGSSFGNRIALSGNTLLVGARKDSPFAVNSGSAFVFVKEGATWSLQAKLLPSEGSESDNFGHDVALSGNTAVIGAKFVDTAALDAGSTYVFTRSGVAWSEQTKLNPGDARENDQCGTNVAISGRTIVVGCSVTNDYTSGSAYTYELP